MADKFADAPIGATHYADGPVRTVYYKFDGHVWKFWNMGGWVRCQSKPILTIHDLPTPPRTATPPEHTLCCGTTCDKQAVNRYIKQLEAVAEAARRVVGNDELRRALGELGK